MSAPAEHSRRRIIREAFLDWVKEHVALPDGQTLEDVTDALMLDTGISPVIEQVLAERSVQIVKGFDAAHDDQHDCGELVWAAMAYLRASQLQNSGVSLREAPSFWPFQKSEWKPRAGALENVMVALALLVAEAERLARLEGRLRWSLANDGKEGEGDV